MKPNLFPDNWIAAARLLQNSEPIDELPCNNGNKPRLPDIVADLDSRFDITELGSEMFTNIVETILEEKIVLIDSANKYIAICPMKFKNIAP